MNFTEEQTQWLYQLQRPWPLVKYPLRALADSLHTTEAALLDFIQSLSDLGMIRRIGAVFDSRKLGYKSCLFAIQADEDDLDAVAKEVCKLPGVTHAYLRSWPKDVVIDNVSTADYAAYPKLWYTLSAPADHFDSECAKLAKFNPIAFPATVRYKIDVVFDLRTRARDEKTEHAVHTPAEIHIPSADQKELIRYYQRLDLDPATPFRDEDLAQLQAWQANGTMRRFALLLFHRATGFLANGMCCWRVEESELADFGHALAQCPEVTHCYARPLATSFPYNLYAMIHKASWEDGMDTFKALTKRCGLPDGGKVFFSTREYKKSSIPFFSEVFE